ncbi:hypothetical protein [Viscerimonas tarda]
MNRELVKELLRYFENIGEKRNEAEEHLFKEIQDESAYFPVASVHRDDLERGGFDVSTVTDEQMEELAIQMNESYTGKDIFEEDMEIIAYQRLDIPKKTDPCCPDCGSYKVEEYDENGRRFSCNTCDYEWRFDNNKEEV